MHSLINIVPRRHSDGNPYYQIRFFDKTGKQIKSLCIPKIKSRAEAYLYARQKLEDTFTPRMQKEDIHQYGILSIDEVRIILALPDNDKTSARNTLTALLGITCGLGVSEICNLKREHINEKDMFIIETAHGERMIPFILNVKERLKKLNSFYPNSRYVIPNLKNMEKPCNPISINRGLFSVLEKIGISKERNIIPSVLWETFVTQLLCDKYIEMETLDYLCGFSRLGTTELPNVNSSSIITAIKYLMLHLDNFGYVPTLFPINWYKY